MALHQALELLGLALAYYLVVTFYDRFRRRRDFKNLRGPEPTSFSIGCLDKYDSLEGIDYHKDLTHKYGSAAKIMGPMGVGAFVFCRTDPMSKQVCNIQEPQLYISDPRGLENILLKQSDAFEEPQYVFVSVLASYLV